MFVPRSVAFGIAALAGALAALIAVHTMAAPKTPPKKPALTFEAAPVGKAMAVPMMAPVTGGFHPVTEPTNKTPYTPAFDNPPPHPTMAAKMTKQAVIDDATEFCKEVGVKLPVPFEAAFFGVASDGDMAPTFYGPVWKLRSGQVEVEVSDVDGVIVELENYDDGNSAAAPDNALPRQRVIEIANNVLKAAHLTEPLADPQPDEDNQPPAALASMDEYTVFYQRKAAGHSFHDQHVAVGMNPQTGKVDGYVVVFQTPLPEPVKDTVTESQASEIGRKFLNGRTPDAEWQSLGHSSMEWYTATVFGHTPPVNGVVSEKPMRIPDSVKAPVLAWFCNYRSRRGYAYLPIDSVTGDIVESGIGFAEPPMRPRLSRKPRPEPKVDPVPKPVTIDRDVVLTTLPVDKPAVPVHGVQRFRVHLQDINAQISLIDSMGLLEWPELRVDEMDAPEVTAKLLAAVKAGKLRLIDGPTEIVPQHGQWGFARVRPVILTDKLYWKPRSIPDRIVSKVVVGPIADNSGEIFANVSLSTKALNKGEPAATPDERFDMSIGGGSGYGREGQWSVFASSNEEEYAYSTGKPGMYKTEGVMHIILFKVDLL